MQQSNRRYTEEKRRVQARVKLGLKGRVSAWANVGQHHEDYGMSPEEHAFAKAHRPGDSKARDGGVGARKRMMTKLKSAGAN